MKRRWITLVILLFCASVRAELPAQEQKPEMLAQQAAESWLKLVDSAKYEESWEVAASAFKAAVTKEDWKSAIRAARDPLGKNNARKFKEANYTKTLEGAPDGEYVVIQYESSFEKQDSV